MREAPPPTTADRPSAPGDRGPKQTTRPSWLLIVGSLAVALVLLAVLVSVVGVGDVFATLASANRVALVGLLVLALLWILAWGYSLFLVLRALAVPASIARSFLLYAVMLFVGTIVPFSVIGAEPIAAMIVARRGGTTYERGLAAVASVGVLNYLPAPVLAVVGLAYFVATATLGLRTELSVLSLLAVTLLVLVAGVLAWRYRHRLSVALLAAVTVIERPLARRLPGVRLPDPEHLACRAEAVVESIDRIAADRRLLLVGACTSVAGWLSLAVALWLSLWAVGAGVTLGSTLFVVPLATVTDFVPLPGGVGSVDAALVLLVVAATGVPAATATAAVLVYRAATLLLPLLVGGVAALALQFT
ncbi:MAG: YbhN family protein [Haloarculaceae archaeon]